MGDAADHTAVIAAEACLERARSLVRNSQLSYSNTTSLQRRVSPGKQCRTRYAHDCVRLQASHRPDACREALRHLKLALHDDDAPATTRQSVPESRFRCSACGEGAPDADAPGLRLRGVLRDAHLLSAQLDESQGDAVRAAHAAFLLREGSLCRAVGLGLRQVSLSLPPLSLPPPRSRAGPQRSTPKQRGRGARQPPASCSRLPCARSLASLPAADACRRVARCATPQARQPRSPLPPRQPPRPRARLRCGGAPLPARS